jgi:hypothetical protein
MRHAVLLVEVRRVPHDTAWHRKSWLGKLSNLRREVVRGRWLALARHKSNFPSRQRPGAGALSRAKSITMKDSMDSSLRRG